MYSMPDPEKNETQKGDEVLRRLLKTPPGPKTGKGEKPSKEKPDEESKG
jgi:hypothetical protein